MNIEAKRTEKLASALYLLTSFFGDLEPMKWRLRELGGRLVHDGGNRSLVQEINSLLTVGRNAGLISDMNYDIIFHQFSLLLSQGQSLGEIFNKLEEKENFVSLAPPAPKNIEQPSIKDKISREVKSRTENKSGLVAVKKNGRQSTILNLLKRKKEIMVRDVSPLIEGVSEKTIQRELLSLVKAGILKKEGEKRWSRYSLAI